MKLQLFVLSLFLLGTPLSAFAQAREPVEVRIPDGTIIRARLRKDFNAKKAQVGDSMELEVLWDVRSQPATTVLMPKDAKLLGKVLAIEPPKEKDGDIAVSVRVVRAEWNGGFARLNAAITEIVPVADTSLYVGAAVERSIGGGTLQRGKLVFSLWGGPTMSSGTAFFLEQRAPEEAAERGDAEAQFRLGVMYQWGEGAVPNLARAAEWYRRAAEQGLAKAQNNLGLLYAQGQGVPQDYVAAYMWFTLAAPLSGDNSKAKRNLQLLESLMTPEQIAEGQRRADEWLKQHPASH